MWAIPLIVVSVGRNRGAGLQLSSLNILSELWGVGLSLVVWYLPWGDSGPACETPIEEKVG